MLTTPYSHHMIHLDYAHERNILGRGSCVAIIDSGIYPHKDIKNQIIGFTDYVNQRSLPYDDNGHGTHVAGIIASNHMFHEQSYLGVAPHASLYIIKVLNQSGEGSLKNFMKAIDHLLSIHHFYNIKIVNISIGALFPIDKKKSELIKEATDALWDAGMVVSVSSGNCGYKKESMNIDNDFSKKITVGVHNDKYMRYCPCEITAPGNQIVSLKTNADQYTYMSGSSMAAPFVSGACALAFAIDQHLTCDELKDSLLRNSSKKDRHLSGKYQINKKKQDVGCLNIQALLKNRFHIL